MESVGLTMKVESRSGYNRVIELVRSAVYEDILAMTKVLNLPFATYPFAEIISSLKQLLDQAAYLWNHGNIDPHVKIRTSPDDHQNPAVSRTLRIGIYPVAANPFHWAHMLAGLSALVRFRLDKIVYLISGSDPRKPSMISAEIRHFMGKEVLKMFAPLFGYSSSAMGSNGDGETNMFKMLALNPEQKIDAFYIVGADHYQRINPKTGGADTIQKIEEHLARNTGNFNDALHNVSIIFIERGARNHTVATDLPIAFIPEMPFAASSTMIREAFQGKCGIESLSLMPYTAYRYAIELGLYGLDDALPAPHKQHKQPATHTSPYQELTQQRGTTVLQYAS
jgi:nicotinic acid mononucleotide adenylyltransferase